MREQHDTPSFLLVPAGSQTGVVSPHTGRWTFVNPLDARRFRTGDAPEIENALLKPRERRLPRIPSPVILKTTTACNMKCTYCRTSSSSGPEMTMETGRVVLERMYEHGTPIGRFVFHGGEPLLNMGFVTSFVEQARLGFGTRGLHVEFCVQTNGTVITPATRSLLDQPDVTLSASLDGPPDVHDGARPAADGRPTYERIVDLLRSHPRSSAVCVITSRNVRRVCEIAEHFLGLGIHSFYFLWAERIGRTDNRLLAKPAELAAAFVELFDWYHEALRAGRTVFIRNYRNWLAPFFSETRSGTCSVCGLTGEMHCLAVDTNGDVYPCDLFWGMPEFLMGNLFNNSLDQVLSSPHLPLNHIRDCPDCEWAAICQNGCPIQSFNSSGSMWTRNPNCKALRAIYAHIFGAIPTLQEDQSLHAMLHGHGPLQDE